MMIKSNYEWGLWTNSSSE